jgi:hypothetical protein
MNFLGSGRSMLGLGMENLQRCQEYVQDCQKDVQDVNQLMIHTRAHNLMAEIQKRLAALPSSPA